jgi:hypothetical protein
MQHPKVKICTGLLICLDKLTVPFLAKKFLVFEESIISILGDILSSHSKDCEDYLIPEYYTA